MELETLLTNHQAASDFIQKSSIYSAWLMVFPQKKEPTAG
jgi:hypothetical protein